MIQRLTKAQVKWVRSLQQKKFRDTEGVFVAEGAKCVNDLQESFELVLKVTHENATNTEIEQMSSLRTPQGVIGVFKQREAMGDRQGTIGNELWVALDGVQDPGNLGTIIRTCDWFGIHHIICSRETADCYNPKVVQATMGALVRVHCHYVNNLAEVLTEYKAAGIPIYGTLLEGENMYAEGCIPTKNQGIIVMGNEGKGLTTEVRNVVTHPLLIPSYPAGIATSESLNVSIATAIVLAEFRRNNTP